MRIPEAFKTALIRGRNDPAYFSEFFCGITPHDGQKRWLANSYEHKENTLSAGNRWGKSTIAAVKFIHILTYRIGDIESEDLVDFPVLNVSVTMDQAKIIWEKAREILTTRDALKWLLHGDPVSSPFPMMRFRTKSSFTVRSTDQPQHLWGPGYAFVNFDEPAFEKKPIDTLAALRTRLLDFNGVLDFTGTPYGRNWYFKQYKKGIQGDEFDEDCYSQTGPTWENPRISSGAIERTKKNMTKAQIEQHLEGKFISSNEGVFRQTDIEKIVDPSMDISNYKRIPGHQYRNGWDVARKNDYLVGITIDVTTKPFEVVAFERVHNLRWEAIYARIRARHSHFGGQTLFDSTGIGMHLEEELEDVRPLTPINLSGPTKTKVIINLQKIIELNLVRIPFIQELIEELTFYDWNDKKIKTDCVFSLAVGLYNSLKISEDGNIISFDSVYQFGDPTRSADLNTQLKKFRGGM